MSVTSLPPGDGPFDSRAQASARFAPFRRAVRRGTFGPGFAAQSLADTIDVFPGAELGRYDLELIGRLAGLLDVIDLAVVMSWIRRAAGDEPDPATYYVRPRPPRLRPVT